MWTGIADKTLNGNDRPSTRPETKELMVGYMQSPFGSRPIGRGLAQLLVFREAMYGLVAMDDVDGDDDDLGKLLNSIKFLFT